MNVPSTDSALLNRFFTITLLALTMSSGLVVAHPPDQNTIQIVSRARQSIVNIEARVPLSDQMGVFGKVLSAHLRDRNESNQKWYLSLGSGIIWDNQGHIVTTKSVVKKSDLIIVKTQNGDTFKARIIGSDDLTNISVLELHSDTQHVFEPLYHRVDKLSEGSWLVLMGYGYGGLPTISPGMAGIPPEDFDPGRHWFQFTAPLRPGNSGSALIDSEGQLAGIALGREEDIGFNAVVKMLTAKNQPDMASSSVASYSSLGVGIPINQLKPIVDQIIRSGRVIRGWVGVSVRSRRDDHETEPGLQVVRIIPGSPADNAGLKIGDHILCVNGMDVADPKDLGKMVREFTPGSRVPVDFNRDGQNLRTEIVIFERPAQNDLLQDDDHETTAAGLPDTPLKQ